MSYEYVTIDEIVDSWGISKRRIQILCKENRLEGAKKVGNIWLIPAGTVKPVDGRISSGRFINTIWNPKRVNDLKAFMTAFRKDNKEIPYFNNDKPLIEYIRVLATEKKINFNLVFTKAKINTKRVKEFLKDNTIIFSKDNLFKLCLALNLSIGEANTLLKCQGYDLQINSDEDLVMCYLLTKKIYNFKELKKALNYL